MCVIAPCLAAKCHPDRAHHLLLSDKHARGKHERFVAVLRALKALVRQGQPREFPH